jgi:hypothetical protein
MRIGGKRRRRGWSRKLDVLWESLKSMNLRLERLLMLVLIMLPIMLVLTLVLALVLVLLMMLQLRMGSIRSRAAVHSYVPV